MPREPGQARLVDLIAAVRHSAGVSATTKLASNAGELLSGSDDDDLAPGDKVTNSLDITS